MGTQVDRVRSHLLSLQQNICEMLVRQDGRSQFVADPEVRENGSLSQPMILSGPGALEKAAVNFSHSIGKQLPPAATERKPEFAGCGFQAVSLSLIVHPKNPYVPTTHANFRYFQVDRGDEEVDWWFGGTVDWRMGRYVDSWIRGYLGDSAFFPARLVAAEGPADYDWIL